MRRLSDARWPFADRPSSKLETDAESALERALRRLIPDDAKAAVVEKDDITTRMVVAVAGGAVFTAQPRQTVSGDPIVCVTRRLRSTQRAMRLQ
jgi:hypothetical protein